MVLLDKIILSQHLLQRPPLVSCSILVIMILLPPLVAQPMAIVIQKTRAVKIIINLLLAVVVVVQAVLTITVNQRKLRGAAVVAPALVLNHPPIMMLQQVRVLAIAVLQERNIVI
jgi:hypothetical protein